MRNKVIGNKGLTLIEVIISLAILGIIALVFLSMFTNGIKGVFNAGRRSKAAYNTQTAMENALESNSTTESAITVNFASGDSATLNSTTGSIQISFAGNPIIVDGIKITSIHNDSRHNIEINAFSTR